MQGFGAFRASGPNVMDFCMGIAKTTAGCEEVIRLLMMQNPDLGF